MKYGSLCRYIAGNILRNAEDSEECVNDCVSGTDSVEDQLACRAAERAISDFLWQQDVTMRVIFVRRYWYFDAIDDICRRTGYSPSKVTSILFRMRRSLREHLEGEGIEV